jgi:hypothetical protein
MQQYTIQHTNAEVLKYSVVAGTVLQTIIGTRNLPANALLGAFNGFLAGLVGNFVLNETGVTDAYVSAKNCLLQKDAKDKLALEICKILAQNGKEAHVENVRRELNNLAFEEVCTFFYYLQNNENPKTIEEACNKMVLMHKIETKTPYIFNLIRQ